MAGGTIAGAHSYLVEVKLGSLGPCPGLCDRQVCIDLYHWWLQETSCALERKLEEGWGGSGIRDGL